MTDTVNKLLRGNTLMVEIIAPAESIVRRTDIEPRIV